MRYLIRWSAGIIGALCLMAVLGGFQPRLQTGIIGVILLLVAFGWNSFSRSGPAPTKSPPGRGERCSGSLTPAFTLAPPAYPGQRMGVPFATCPQCGRRVMVIMETTYNKGLFRAHDRSGELL